jgi:predicted nucleic acid-binding protein
LIVVDTNLLAGFFIPGDKSDAAERIFTKDPHWAAPFLWRSELRNVLAMGLRRKMLDLEDACLVMEEAETLMSEDEYDVPSSQVLDLARQNRLTAYDCEFVALARQLAVPLVTWDRAILAAFPETAISPEQFIRT